jgi:hypothetical protein
MNTVLDEADEVYLKKNTRRRIGRIVLKGDNISLICNIRYSLLMYLNMLVFIVNDEQ